MSQATLGDRRFSWRRHSVPLPLRLATGLGSALVAAALAFSAATARPSPSIQLTAGPGTTISILNSKEGLAVLSAGNMRPGDSAAGSVTITNTGDGDGIFSLRTSSLSDVPGAGAGILSGKLDLAIVDGTVPASPVTVFSGKVNGVGTIALGTFAAGEARTYDFTITFPNGASGAENAYQGATTSVRLNWDAVLVGSAPAPAIATTAPADGATVVSAASVALTSTEALASVQSPTLDGSPVGATVSGTDVDFPVGALGPGPHTIAGLLEGLDGQTTPFRLHFTIWSGATVDYPYVEMNSPAGEQIALATADGLARLTVAANSWSGGASGDWAVMRVDPDPAPAASGGLAGAGSLYTVSAYWALGLGGLTTFDHALDLRVTAPSSPVIPAAYSAGTWRRLEPIPGGTTLPAGWQDGYYTDGSQVHVLTLRSGSFGLLRDVQAPSKPRAFKSGLSHRHVILKWRAASDNEGVGSYLVYAGSKIVKTLPASARSYDAGRAASVRSRVFRVAARDEAGNVGPRTGALVSVPRVVSLTLAGAKTALTARGLKTGKITYVFSSAIAKGRVAGAGKSGLVPVGTAVPLQVSKGAASRPAPESNGSSPADGSGATNPPPTFPGTDPSYPAYPTTPSTVEPSSTGSAGAGTTPADGQRGSGGGKGAGASPERYTAARSPVGRRTAGLVLLGALLLGAAALALHARRRTRPDAAPQDREGGQLLFWDERLARTTVSSLKRLITLVGR